MIVEVALGICAIISNELFKSSYGIRSKLLRVGVNCDKNAFLDSWIHAIFILGNRGKEVFPS